MKKKEMIENIEKIIDELKKTTNLIHKSIDKMNDSPRIVSDLGMIYSCMTDRISQLEHLKKDIENHDNVKIRTDAMFGMPVYEDGIVISEDDDKED